MRAMFVNGDLHVSMPEQEFSQIVEQAKTNGIAEGKRQAELSMMANGTGVKSRKVKRSVAKRKQSIPRPAMRRKGKATKRDWKSIVQKRLATQARNKAEKERQAAPQSQAEAI